MLRKNFIIYLKPLLNYQITLICMCYLDVLFLFKKYSYEFNKILQLNYQTSSKCLTMLSELKQIMLNFV